VVLNRQSYWKEPGPDPLEWCRPPPVFTEPVSNKEPTLPPTRTQLESIMPMDSRSVLEWAARREEPHDFLGRFEAWNFGTAAAPKLRGTPVA
jgi:hypothetical protein